MTPINCYLCDAENQEIVRTKIRHDIQRKVLKCPNCDLVWLEPQEQNLAEYYRAQYRIDHSPSVEEVLTPDQTFNMYLPFMDERIARIKDLLEPNMSILEIGSSTGHFLSALEPYVKERTGVELNAEHAAFAAEKMGITVYDKPINDTNHALKSFDFIFMFHVFEHVPDPIGFLQSVTPYLSNKGRLYIEVPNISDALISKYRIEEYADFYYRDPHLFYFSPTTMHEITNKAGFSGRIEMVQRYGFSNHLNWVNNKTPQKDAELAMGIPTMHTSKKTAGNTFESELDVWLKKIDNEYRNLIKKHQLAEAMVFISD